MTDFPILSAIVLVPLIAGALTVLIPAAQTTLIKAVNLLAGVICAGLSAQIWRDFPK